MKTFLILGGTGFIGLNIIDFFTSKGCKMIVLTRNKIRAENLLYDKNSTTIIEGELKDIDTIKSIILKFNIGVIIHLVSNLIPSSKEEDFNKELLNIVSTTYEIINYISSKEIKFIFFSSGGTIYGKSDKKLAELDNLEPINYYGYSKLLIENYITFKHRTDGLKYIIIRPSNAYGKYQKAGRNQGFIAVAISKLIKDETIEIWGDGKTVRDYIEVQDLAEALFRLLESNVVNETFNVGSGESHNLLEILKILEKNLNKKAKIVYKNKRSVDVNKVILNIDKLKEYIYFQPKTTEEGIRSYIDAIKGKYEK